MRNNRQSIRLKIRLGYYLIVAMILGLSAFTFIELNYLEKKIMFGEAISEFFDATLEIRRFEKNYFLYEQTSDFEESIRYVVKARDLFENDIAGFASLASPGQITTLHDNLRTYEDRMKHYERLNRSNARRGAAGDAVLKARLEKDIRKTGKDIITISEAISKTERKSLQALLSASRRILLLSIAALVGLVIVIGQIMARVVVKPLKLMETSMELIADGRYETIRIDSKDREVASLTRAFNKMLRELDLRQRHLIQSEKLASLGTLLSGVAHELNNPLSNISTSNQILQEELGDALKTPAASSVHDPAFISELIHQIDEQTDRARNIVRTLLEFSRHTDFKKERLPLRQLFTETIRFIKGQLPTGVTITLEVPEETVISADKQRMQQAFLNLIKNAVEAFPRNEGAIFIKAETRRAIDAVDDEKIGIYNYLKYRGKCTLEDDTVDIEIRDTGAGIPADIVSKIFDPFFTTKDVGRGSGLGLSIVHEIIEEHDGCIAVDSEPGKGTSFLIRLPVK